MTVQAPLKASSLYFSPVASDHQADPRGYGRYMLTIPVSLATELTRTPS